VTPVADTALCETSSRRDHIPERFTAQDCASLIVSSKNNWLDTSASWVAFSEASSSAGLTVGRRRHQLRYRCSNLQRTAAIVFVNIHTTSSLPTTHRIQSLPQSIPSISYPSAQFDETGYQPRHSNLVHFNHDGHCTREIRRSKIALVSQVRRRTMVIITESKVLDCISVCFLVPQTDRCAAAIAVSAPFSINESGVNSGTYIQPRELTVFHRIHSDPLATISSSLFHYISDSPPTARFCLTGKETAASQWRFSEHASRGVNGCVIFGSSVCFFGSCFGF
jgi:hypothetical protein